MEGLEAVEVYYSRILLNVETFRIDSEYFKKKYISDEETVDSNSDRFNTFSDRGITVDASAFYPSIEPYYGTGNLPFLRVADVDAIIDYDKCTTIPAEICDTFKTLKKVFVGDIVFTKGGSVARIGFVTKESVACRDLIFLNTSLLGDIHSKFLYLYFQTDFYCRHLIRSSSQTAQPHLTITLVRKLPIYKASESFMKICSELVSISYKMKDKSIELYKEAEQTLLSALGLTDYTPSEENISVKSFSESFGESGRLDSEFYQPKYDEIERALESNNYKLLGEIAEVKKGLQARSEIGTIPYASIKDIDSNLILTDGKASGDNLIYIETDELALAITGATIGKVGINNTNEKIAICGDLLKIKSKELPPEYLLLVLDSSLIQELCKRSITGATNGHLSPDVVNSFSIPILALNLMNDLTQKVKMSFKLRHDSKHLLDLAKRAVELAIEESEEVALEMISKERPS